jgi:hypothetical protein
LAEPKKPVKDKEEKPNKGDGENEVPYMQSHENHKHNVQLMCVEE